MYGVKAKMLPKGKLLPCLEILLAHNLVIEKHGERSKLTAKKFRREFLSGRIKVKLFKKDQTDLGSLTEDIKMKVIAHHIKMATRIAKHFCRTFNVINTDEVVSEAGSGLIEALYAYTNSNIYFSTYAHWVVTNTLKDYFRENNNGLSPVAKIGIEVSNRIEQHRQKANGPISFDQAITELGLGENEISDATQAQRWCAPASAIQLGDPKGDGIRPAILDGATTTDEFVDMDLMNAFNTCPLSEIERAVINAALEHWHGWMVDLGRDFPDENGEPRTRQHIRMVMWRARRKIQAHYDGLCNQTLCKAAS